MVDKRKIPRELAEAKVQEWGVQGYIEASAKSGDNIPYIFGLITQEMLSIYFNR